MESQRDDVKLSDFKVNPWIKIPKTMIVGSLVPKFIGENISFLGKITAVKGNKFTFETGCGSIHAVSKNKLFTQQLIEGSFFDIYGFINGRCDVMIRYICNQDKNVSAKWLDKFHELIIIFSNLKFA